MASASLLCTASVDSGNYIETPTISVSAGDYLCAVVHCITGQVIDAKPTVSGLPDLVKLDEITTTPGQVYTVSVWGAKTTVSSTTAKYRFGIPFSGSAGGVVALAKVVPDANEVVSVKYPVVKQDFVSSTAERANLTTEVRSDKGDIVFALAGGSVSSNWYPDTSWGSEIGSIDTGLGGSVRMYRKNFSSETPDFVTFYGSQNSYVNAGLFLVPVTLEVGGAYWGIAA